MDYEKHQKLQQAVEALCKDAGYDQFVLLAHHCASRRVSRFRSAKGCGLIASAFAAIDGLCRGLGMLEIMNNHNAN